MISIPQLLSQQDCPSNRKELKEVEVQHVLIQYRTAPRYVESAKESTNFKLINLRLSTSHFQLETARNF